MLCISMLKLEEVDQNIFSKTSKCLEKWSKIPMYYDDINGENDLIFSIINGANYPAIELHIHWLYWKYNIQKSNFEDSDFEFIKEWCKRDEKAALSYCYNLSNLLRLIGSDDALRTKVFEFFTQESDNNRVQTMVCMCGNHYIYPQLIAALQTQIKDTACMEDFFEGRDESLIRYVCKYISGAYVYGFADDSMVEYIQNIRVLHNKEKFAFTDYLCRFWNKIKENLELRKNVKIIEAILRAVRFVNIPSVEILNMFIEAERLLPDDCKFNVELSNIAKLYSADFDKAHSFVCVLLRHCYYVREQDLEEIHMHYVHDDVSIRDQKVQLSNILRECNLINLNQYKKWNLS